MYHYTECGLRNVWLLNGFKWHDTPHGKALSIKDIDGLYDAIASTLVEKRSLTGAEFRFLRKRLDMSQEGLGSWMGVDSQSVARWEKGRPTRMAERFLRAVYREHKLGNADIQHMVERLNELDQHNHAKLLFEVGLKKGWHTKAA